MLGLGYPSQTYNGNRYSFVGIVNVKVLCKNGFPIFINIIVNTLAEVYNLEIIDTERGLAGALEMQDLETIPAKCTDIRVSGNP